MNAVLTGQIDGYLCFETRANFYATHDYTGRVSVYATRLKPHLYALAMPKNSPLRRPINVAMLQLSRDSVWESLLERYGLEQGSSEVALPTSQKTAGK